MTEPLTRDRHATVAQMRDVLARLQVDDVLCVGPLPTGNIAVFRAEQQIGWIELSPQDLVPPWPEPRAELELFDKISEAMG